MLNISTELEELPLGPGPGSLTLELLQKVIQQTGIPLVTGQCFLLGPD